MKKLFYILVLAIAFTSCVKDTDYDTPKINTTPVSINDTLLISMENIVQTWETLNSGITSNFTMVNFADESDDPVYLEGYVVSDDKTGNFYQELFIQDSISNPTHAVKIYIATSNLYTKFNVGRKIYVKLNGLAINKSHGEMVIGVPDGTYIEGISGNRAKNCIIRDEESYSITPKIIDPSQITDDLLGQFVQLDAMQFTNEYIGESFVDLNDDYDSYRTMESCENGGTLELETSTFATFKMQPIPVENGTVVGILSKDYGDDFYVLRVNSPSAFSFNNSRCYPLFEDSFTNGFQDNWTTYSVTGPQVWAISSYAGESFAKMSGYSGSAIVNEDWLISKALDLTTINNAYLNFVTAKKYTGNDIKIYVSTDYDPTVNANPTTATWTELSAVLSVDNYVWTSSGSISLADFLGSNNVRIGFKYTSTSSQASTWEVDKVKILVF